MLDFFDYKYIRNANLITTLSIYLSFFMVLEKRWGKRYQINLMVNFLSIKLTI